MEERLKAVILSLFYEGLRFLDMFGLAILGLLYICFVFFNNMFSRLLQKFKERLTSQWIKPMFTRHYKAYDMMLLVQNQGGFKHGVEVKMNNSTL